MINEQVCQKTFFSHSLSFRDNGGPNFQGKCTNFGAQGAKVHYLTDFGAILGGVPGLG